MAVELEKLPPHDLEAERSVLGSLLLENGALVKVAPFLHPEDFYSGVHRTIFGAMLELQERREPVDAITLGDELRRRGLLDDVGGDSYLASLFSAVPTWINVEHYAHIVERLAIYRTLIDTAGKIGAIGYSAPSEVEDALDRAGQMLFNVFRRTLSRDFAHVQDILNKFFESVDYLQANEDAILGVATGFVDLDKLLGGLQRSDLIILAGRPSVGKSALGISLAQRAAVDHDATVAVFTLEMSKEQVVQRMLASEASRGRAESIDTHRLRLGRLRPEEWERVTQAAGVLAKTNIYIDDSPNVSIMEMRIKARRLAMERDLSLIVVDYLQLMQGSRSENRVQEISEVSRGLKALARELDVPVLAAAQLSRAVETRQDHIPQLSDLRESGSIEQDADVVMFLYRDEVYNKDTELKNIADVIVAKHRNGPIGNVRLWFRKETASFDNLETQHGDY